MLEPNTDTKFQIQSESIILYGTSLVVTTLGLQFFNIYESYIDLIDVQPHSISLFTPTSLQPYLLPS